MSLHDELPQMRSQADGLLIPSLLLIDRVAASGQPSFHQGCVHEELSVDDILEHPEAFDCLRYAMNYTPKAEATPKSLANAEARMVLWAADWIQHLTELDESLEDGEKEFIMRDALPSLIACELAWRTASEQRRNASNLHFDIVHLPCETFTNMESDHAGAVFLTESFVSSILRQTWEMLDLGMDEKESALIKALIILGGNKRSELRKRAEASLLCRCFDFQDEAVARVRCSRLFQLISDFKGVQDGEQNSVPILLELSLTYKLRVPLF